MTPDKLKEVLEKYGIPETVIDELHDVASSLNESHTHELMVLNEAHINKVETLQRQISEYEAYVMQEHEKLKNHIAEYEQYAKSEYKALEESIEARVDSMSATLSSKATDYVEHIVEGLTSQLDNYAQLVVDKFIEEKSGLIESVQLNIRSQEAMMKMKQLMENYYFTVAPPKESKPLIKENRDMAKLYNELLVKYTNANRANSKYKKQLLIQEALSDADLSSLQRERVNKYLKDYPETKSDNELRSYIKLIVEDVKKKNDKTTLLTENNSNSFPQAPEVKFDYMPVTNPVDARQIAEWAKHF